jgi:hypothetical protein
MSISIMIKSMEIITKLRTTNKLLMGNIKYICELINN